MTGTDYVGLVLLLAGAAVTWPQDGLAQDTLSRSPARVAFTRMLPPLDGHRLEATIVEVTYGPGESSAPHRHPCPVIGYVIEGEYRTKSGTEAETVYRAGQTFYEVPDAVHQVSANASTIRPVRFLAYFVCDRPGALSLPAR